MTVLHVMHVPGADPARDECVARMSEQATVCVHPDPERTGAMRTWLSALTCDSDDPWQVVVQDDVTLLTNWEQHLSLALSNSPSNIVGLAWTGKWASKGWTSRKPYVRGPNVLQGVAVAYHRSVVAPLADFGYRLLDADSQWTHDDLAANIFSTHVLGEDPSVVTFPLFGYVTTRSLLGHGRYREAEHTITSLPAGFMWSPHWAQENKYRDDDAAQAAVVKVYG